ncbi:M15 family metallopeptidase [Nocardioides yefusunii]|uniref:M15 family metallopeptidase n=1 Tax=Nocardioides yefusunii TaxID=2500546 RepID=A0ABW1QYD9_9ACTN|nr:M15 family metallopeptidase [Nocardioides yefusunii]
MDSSRAVAIVAALVVAVLTVTVTVTAGAEPEHRTSAPVQVTAGSARAGERVEVVVTTPDAIGAGGVEGVVVVVERRHGTAWTRVGTVTPDTTGRVTVQVVVDRLPAHNLVRARAEVVGIPGPWREATLGLDATRSTVVVTAPARVVDGKHARVTVRWSAVDVRDGVGVVGVPGTVVLQRQVKRSGRWSGWSTFRVLQTDAAGRAGVRVRPRYSHRWRVVTRPSTWTTTPRSSVARTRNVPPGHPVRLPAKAPRPRITLGPQARADTSGADVTVRRIPDAVWRSMRGISWRPGCPVGRSHLRLVETNYYAFDGYRRRGQVVVAAVVVDNFVGAFRDMHAAKVPIRSLRLPDRFGRSTRLGGADDLRSMAADNTSVFNCRAVVGRPHARSPHSWGRSLDLNPWENPFRSGWGVVPNTWWPSRSHPDVAWRSTRHRVVRILARNGFRWTYGHGDLHHFDAVPGRAARASASASELRQDEELQQTLRECDFHCE